MPQTHRLQLSPLYEDCFVFLAECMSYMASVTPQHATACELGSKNSVRCRFQFQQATQALRATCGQ